MSDLPCSCQINLLKMARVVFLLLLHLASAEAGTLHLKTGTFGKSAHFQLPTIGTSGADRRKKPRPLFNANIPPKWCTTRLFYAFSTFGFYDDFEIWFLYVPFPTLK